MPHNYDQEGEQTVQKPPFGEDVDDLFNTHSSDWEPRNAKHADETMPSSYTFELHPGKSKVKEIMEKAGEIPDPDDELAEYEEEHIHI